MIVYRLTTKFYDYPGRYKGEEREDPEGKGLRCGYKFCTLNQQKYIYNVLQIEVSNCSGVPR